MTDGGRSVARSGTRTTKNFGVLIWSPVGARGGLPQRREWTVDDSQASLVALEDEREGCNCEWEEDEAMSESVPAFTDDRGWRWRRKDEKGESRSWDWRGSAPRTTISEIPVPWKRTDATAKYEM